MLKGIQAPQIAPSQQVALSPRQRFDWGKSGLTFTPNQPFDIGKPSPDSGLDDLAKSLKEQRRFEIEEAKIENERKRREEAERHNREVERIRAASEGVGVGSDRGMMSDESTGMDDLGAFKMLQGLGSPASEPAESAPASSDGRYSREVPKKNMSLGNAGLQESGTLQLGVPISSVSPEPTTGLLANAEPISPEDVGTPDEETVVCNENGKCESRTSSTTKSQAASLSRVAALQRPSQESGANVLQMAAAERLLNPEVAAQMQASADKALGLSSIKLDSKEARRQSATESAPSETSSEESAKRVEENKINFKENKAPLAGIKLEPYDVPYNRFASPEIARAYSKAVMIGTPTLKANPPEPIRDRKGKIAGYTVKWEDNSEAIAKKEERLAAALERTNKFEADQAAKRAKLIMMEGRAVQAQDALRNYVRSNGLREALARFIPAYETASSDNGGNKGVSDVDLIDTYGRAMGGGKITEAQSNLIKDSKTLKEKAEVVFGKNFGAGDRLSQSQRDQMLRNMLEAHNVQADIANNVLNVARERLLAEGIKDERFLPQQFTSGLKLKVDARNEVNRLENAQKNLRLSAESAASNKLLSQEQKIAQLRKIKEQTADYQHEIESIKKQLDDEEYSGSEILNLKRFKQGKGGFIAGGGTAVEAELYQ